MIATKSSLEFTLPRALEATEPPEERGRGRDDVRLLVSHRSSGKIEHHRFSDLAALLRPGDLLVFNRSATVNAALEATAGSQPAVLHVARRLSDGEWIVELRHAEPDSLRTTLWLDARAGTEIALRGGGRANLLRPAVDADAVRLWVAEVTLELPADEYLRRWNGRSSTATSPNRGCSAPTRRSLPSCPAAPRCHQRRGPSRPSW